MDLDAHLAGYGILRAGFVFKSVLGVHILKSLVLIVTFLTAFSSPALAETISPRRLLEVADLSGPVISPDGRSVAFRLERAIVERNTYDTAWYVQALDGASPPHKVAEGGIPLRNSAGASLPATAMWSPDGRWIYYRAFLNGKIDVWRAAADGSGAEALTLDPADVLEFSLSPDGGALTYRVGADREEVTAAEQAEYDRGIRLDETVFIGQPLFRSGNTEGRLATQRYSGLWFNLTSLLADAPERWKTLDLLTRERHDLSASNRAPSQLAVSDLGQGVPEPWMLAPERDSSRIALLIRSGEMEGLTQKPDVQLAMLPDSRSSQLIKCKAVLCVGKAISSIQWRPNSDEVMFTVSDPTEGLAQSVSRWNVRTGAVRTVTRSTGLLSGGRDRFSSCGVSTNILVCVTSKASQPPRLEQIDIESGQRRVLFDPNASLATDMASTVRVRLLRWTDSIGSEFTGQFFQARKGADHRSPLFVTYYSCDGFLRGGVGDEWPLASLAEEGISALCINQAPYRRDAVERYNLGLRAVASIIDRLASEGEIDRSRVGMGGLSYGTEVTLWTLSEANLLHAASVTSPMISPNYYLLNSLKGENFFTELQRLWQLGAPQQTPERWHELSPAYKLDRITAPILMQMPEQEYLHSLDYAIPLIRRLQADVYVFPNEPHQKFQPKHKLAAYERNLDWFRFWLQGYEDPDLSKAEQYRHWQEMRADRNADQPAKLQSH